MTYAVGGTTAPPSSPKEPVQENLAHQEYFKPTSKTVYFYLFIYFLVENYLYGFLITNKKPREKLFINAVKAVVWVGKIFSCCVISKFNFFPYSIGLKLARKFWKALCTQGLPAGLNVKPSSWRWCYRNT